MGCVGSLPLVEGDGRLPVKPHLRTAFDGAGTTHNQPPPRAPDGPPGQSSAVPGSTPTSQHDLVLLHSTTGMSWAVTLLAELQGQHGLSVWCPTDPRTTTSGCMARVSSITGGEIRPESGIRALGSADLNVSQVAGMVSSSALGLLVLVTAGSTWDDGVLACLKHPSCRERPLLLLHAPESCPPPNVSDWPTDVQQQLISRDTPKLTFISAYAQYGAAMALENLRQQQRRRSGNMNGFARLSPPPAPSTGKALATTSYGKALATTSHNGVTPDAMMMSPPRASTSQGAPTIASVAEETGVDAFNDAFNDDTCMGSNAIAPVVPVVDILKPWQQVQQHLKLLKAREEQLQGQHGSADAGAGAAKLLAVVSGEGCLPAALQAGSACPAVVLAVHHPAMLAGATAVAAALARHFHVAIVDGCRGGAARRQARHTLHAVQSLDLGLIDMIEPQAIDLPNGGSSDTSTSSSTNQGAVMVTGSRTPSPADVTAALAALPLLAATEKDAAAAGATCASQVDVAAGLAAAGPVGPLPQQQQALEHHPVSPVGEDGKAEQPTVTTVQGPGFVTKVGRVRVQSPPPPPVPLVAAAAGGRQVPLDGKVAGVEFVTQKESGEVPVNPVHQKVVDAAWGQNDLARPAQAGKDSNTDQSTTPVAHSAVVDRPSQSSTPTVPAGGAGMGLHNQATPTPDPAPQPQPEQVTPTRLMMDLAQKATTSLFAVGPAMQPHTSSPSRPTSKHFRSMSMGAAPGLLHLFQPNMRGMSMGRNGTTPQLQGAEEGPPAAPPCVVLKSGTPEAVEAIKGCRHYVLFTGYNLGTASKQAGAEVHQVLQCEVTLHLVCEASFNILRPDTRAWSLVNEEAMQVTQAWLRRLLFYPDHLEPFLAALSRRLIGQDTDDVCTSLTLPGTSSKLASFMHKPGSRGPSGSGATTSSSQHFDPAAFSAPARMVAGQSSMAEAAVFGGVSLTAANSITTAATRG